MRFCSAQSHPAAASNYHLQIDHMLTLFDREAPKSISIACHDAGATNIIQEWVKRAPEARVRAHLGGPAVEIWTRAFPTAVNYGLDQALDESDLLITGTGWASHLEHDARAEGIRKRIPTVAVIDNWVNYKARFVREGVYIFPDEIWVTDRFALSLATDEFPRIPIRLLPNYYLEAKVETIHAIQSERGDTNSANLLYVLEPIREVWNRKERLPGEFQALNYFMKNRRKISDFDLNIILRPHPSESPDKYSEWVDNQSSNIQISQNTSIENDIARSSYVVGCQTYALVVALMAGKNVFSSLPDYAPQLPLPYQGIQELRNL